MIITADLHWGLQQDNPLWHDVSLGLANDMHDSAVKNNDNVIAVLGDLFDNNRTMTQKTQDLALEIVNGIWKDFSVILLQGNHDTYYKNRERPNWLKMFKATENVVVVDKEPYIRQDKCFVPWGYDISTLEWRDYLFGHFEINSFRMNNFYECKTSTLNSKDFTCFKAVFSGHFHFPQTYNNITYLGSPFQQNFGDVGSQRGYYLWNNGLLTFIPFEKAPKFVRIRTSEKFLPEHITGNIVKLIFDKDYGTRKNNEIVEKIEMFGPAALSSIDTSSFGVTSDISEAKTEEVVVKKNRELIEDYIKNMELPAHLKVGTLLKMVDLLAREEGPAEDMNHER